MVSDPQKLMNLVCQNS